MLLGTLQRQRRYRPLAQNERIQKKPRPKGERIVAKCSGTCHFKGLHKTGLSLDDDNSDLKDIVESSD